MLMFKQCVNWNKEANDICSSYISWNECNLISECKFEENRWIGVHNSNSKLYLDSDNATFEYFNAQNPKFIDISLINDTAINFITNTLCAKAEDTSSITCMNKS